MESQKSIPSFYSIQDIFTNESRAEEFLFEKGIFYPQPKCYLCQSYTKRKGRLWRCINKRCHKTVSIAKGSFFEGHKIKYSEILMIAYLWLSKVSSDSIQIMTGHSSKTISAFIGYLHQLVSENVNREDCIIGGPSIEVEIDESKISKRKYNRGHHIEGAWIFGGVERTPERRIFVEIVPNRSAETLKEIIQRQVAQGSIILSDCWKGYQDLNSLGYLHQTVNHSEGFIDSNTLTHTNGIEATWSGIKRRIPIRNRNANTVEMHLLYYIWRRQNNKRLWEALLHSLASTLYE
jgi:hypothetical protein